VTSLAASVSDRVRLPSPGTAALWLALALTGLVIGVWAVVAPLLGVAALVALAFAIATAWDLAAGVAAFTVLTFFERIPGTPETGITVVKLAGALLALVWIVRMLRRQSGLPFFPQDHPAAAFAVVAFGAWSLASILWAEKASSAQGSSIRLIQGAILLIIVYAALRERRHVLWVLWAYVAGAVLSAVLGVAGATEAEQVGPGSDTIRLAGGIGDANELAAILVPAVVIAAGLLVVTRTLLGRFVLSVSIVLIVLALFWTQSRGGLVAMAATAVIAPLFAGSTRPRLIALIASIGALAVTYFALVAPPEQLNRITSFDAGGGTGRPDLWAISITMAKDHPVVGIGAGNFVVVEPRYATRDIDLRRVDLIVDTPKGAHNTYLHTLTELGMVGLLLLLAGVLACLTICYRGVLALEREGERELGLLGRAVIVGIIGMLAAFVFISAAHREQLWLLLGVAASFATLARSIPGRMRA